MEINGDLEVKFVLTSSGLLLWLFMGFSIILLLCHRRLLFADKGCYNQFQSWSSKVTITHKFCVTIWAKCILPSVKPAEEGQRQGFTGKSPRGQVPSISAARGKVLLQINWVCFLASFTYFEVQALKRLMKRQFVRNMNTKP